MKAFWKMGYSNDHLEGTPKDILKLKMQFTKIMICRFKDFSEFPFDMPVFEMRFELSHFHLEIEGKEKTYRFDFFRRWTKEISWKPFSNFLAEFEIDYTSARMLTLVEQKISGGETIFYYPGFLLQFKMVRDPFPKIVRFFIPTLIISTLLIGTFKTSMFDLSGRLGLLSIALLTYISLMTELSSSLFDM